MSTTDSPNSKHSVQFVISIPVRFRSGYASTKFPEEGIASFVPAVLLYHQLELPQPPRVGVIYQSMTGWSAIPYQIRFIVEENAWVAHCDTGDRLTVLNDTQFRFSSDAEVERYLLDLKEFGWGNPDRSVLKNVDSMIQRILRTLGERQSR